MSIVTPDGILNVENATLRVPSIEVQGVNVTTALSTLSNVGIGTASPDERLHVHGPDAGFILQSNLNSATMEIGGPGGAVMDLKGAFTDDYDLRIKTTGTGGVISSVGEANHLVFGAASGYTGFGVASPQFKIDAQGSAGVDAVSNPITHNSVILYDDQESTTTFSGTSGGSSSGRDTTNKYYELNSLTQSTVGYIHWPIQLPNSFTAEFERYSGGGTGGNDLLFSFFNTSAPTTDGNHGGYKVYVSEKYGGGGQKVAIKYRNAELINKTISIANASWQKVVVSYDRGSISVSFNGKLVVSYEHTQNADAYTGAYIGFLATTDSLTNYHRIRNVKITSGAAKWIYTNSATSNAASLAYLSGNVGIGTQTPTELLEVSGNVKVSSGYHLMGDGGLISNIATTLQSISDQGNTVSNTIQFTNTTTGLTSTGNVEVTNNKFFKGDGGLISNIATTLGDIVDQGNATSNTMVFANANVALNASGNIEVVNSKFFKGDGGLISNIATTLQAITDQGNVSSNTLQFTNTDVAFITTANVGIANSAPTVSLSVGSNLHVDEYGSNVLDIVGNVSMSNLTLSGFGIEASYGLQHVTAENATTAETITMTHASKALDITSNVEMGGTLKFDSNAAITSVTGDVINQGFMEQPTQGLTNYHTYIEGHGTYEASASSYDSTYSLFPWEAFDSDTSTRWTISTSDDNYNASSGEWDATAIAASPTVNTVDVAGTRHSGHWLQIKLPYQIVLSHSNVFPQTTARAPRDGVILGSNDGEDWYELQRFTGKTYTSGQWTQIDVNAETSYQYFRMCVTKNGGDAKLELTEWRLFAKDRITKLADNILLNGSIASDTLNTGYIKWPKVQLLANSQSGYEVSVSSQYDATVPGYLAFNGIGGHLGGEGWTSGSTTFDATTGAAHSSNAALFDGVRCEWIQLKLPRNKKIKLSHFVIAPRTNSGSSVSPEDAPKEGAMYGSNDGTTWTKLITYSGLTYGGAAGDDSEKVVVRSDTKYQYFRLTVTKRNIATAGGTWIDIAELRLFERSLGVAQNPDKATLQVGGSLGLAKVSEIFAGDDIVMELDGPHDRPLTKYPEVAMTANSSGGYAASASSNYSGYNPWEVFDDNNPIGGNTGQGHGWASHITAGAGSAYNTSTGLEAQSVTHHSGSAQGEWIQIELPQAITLSSFDIESRSETNYVANMTGFPKNVILYGSTNGSSWGVVKDFTTVSKTLGAKHTEAISSSTAYKYYALVIESIHVSGTDVGFATIGQLRLYGTEQGDVSTDLVWSPVYNKPGTRNLEVYWDANDKLSYMGTGTTVNDLSGNGITGTISGTNGFDTTYNAWTFDGNADYIEGTLPSSFAGDQAHSLSFWFKRGTDHDGTLVSIAPSGGESTSAVTQIRVANPSSGQYTLAYLFWSNDIRYNPTLVDDTWYHLVVTYAGGGGTVTNKHLYLNGELINPVSTSGGSYGNALNITASSKMRIGSRVNTSSMNYLNGSMASVRVYTKALQATQVKELYDWQKDFFFGTKSTMTLYQGNLGLGASSPTDRLEVVGRVKADSSKIPTGVDRNAAVIRSETGPHDRPLTKYPEVAMTASTVGGYTVSEPTNTFHSNAAFRLHQAFDDSEASNWETVGGSYNTSTRDPQTSGSYVVTTVASGTTYYGVYAQMLAPIGVKVSHVYIRPQNTYGLERLPGIAVFVGSNDGTTWTLIRSVTNNSGALNTYTRYNVNATQAYKYIRIIWNKLTTAGTTTSYRDRAAASEIKIYGYEQGDVSTDVTLSSVYNKPGTQHLEVYWDANDSNSYAGSGTTVTDLSGSGITGTISGTNGYNTTYNAWVFDGNGDYVSGTLGNPAGAWVHSASVWFKASSLDTQYDTVFSIGDYTAAEFTTLYIKDSATSVSIYGSGVVYSWVPTIDAWHHAVVVMRGTTSGVADIDLYMDGTKLSGTQSGTATTRALPASASFRLGRDVGAGTYYLNGSIANFRIFSKALSADQVKELYDWQKDYFLGSRSSMTLYQGNLGLGVAEPTARLEIAGNERVQEYPPRAMTGYETYMEGHGVFRASASSELAGNGYMVWEAFDKVTGGTSGQAGAADQAWISANSTYTGSTYHSTKNLGTDHGGTATASGEYLILELPHKLRLSSVAISPRGSETTHAPRDGKVYGSNDMVNWTEIGSFTGLGHSSGQYAFVTVNATTDFKMFAVVTTAILFTNAASWLGIGELKYFGTPASSTLDDGHLTLGKALTLPRVSGHTAGAETPRAESLVVHYDTTVNTSSTDITGRGNHGTFNGNAFYDSADRSFQFDGTGDNIRNTAPTGFPTGDAIYSMSAWVYMDGTQPGTLSQIITFGSAWSSQTLASMYVENGNKLATDIGGNTCKTTNAVLSDKTWHHVAIVKRGTGQMDIADYDLYVDGVLITDKTSSGVGTQNMGTITGFSVGMAFNGSNDPLKGRISNPKVWNVALTGDDITKDYALGRTGKALNITDTAVCIGGIAPRAQLDVRGSALVGGNLGVGTTNPLSTLQVGDGVTNVTSGDASGSITVSGTGAIKSNSGRPGMYHRANVGLGLWSDWAMSFEVNGNSTEAMRIKENGNVGIGTATPHARLTVHGNSGTITNNTFRYFSYNDSGGSGAGAWGGTGKLISIWAQRDIVSQKQIVSHVGALAASDQRIKNNIVDADDAECLETLRLLKPKKYEYKDVVDRGEEPVWGFIAQEVKETLPYATQLRQDVLPNIYELANVSSSNVITFTNFNTSNLESNATTLVRTMGIDGEQHDVHLAEVIDAHSIRVEEDLTDWIGSVDAEGNVITEITTTTVTAEEYEALEDKTGFNKNDDDTYTKTSTTYPGNQLFVYGQQVDDFVFLKKEAIWTVATAALQEVDRQLQAEKAKVADLLARVTALENA